MEKNKKMNSATSRHVPMPIELRAKQFMPFAAVTGLEKALREKEMEREQSEGKIEVAEQPNEL